MRAVGTAFAEALFDFDVPMQGQVINGALHCGWGQTQILCNPSYGRPALTVRICSVYEIHIHMHSTARKVVAINGIKIIHLAPPS